MSTQRGATDLDFEPVRLWKDQFQAQMNNARDAPSALRAGELLALRLLVLVWRGVGELVAVDRKDGSLHDNSGGGDGGGKRTRSRPAVRTPHIGKLSRFPVDPTANKKLS